MSNSFQWRAQLARGDLVRDQFADVAVAMIDPHDIAAVAMAALFGDGHEGATYRLTGPEPLRPADRVRILGHVLGRDLLFEAKTNDEARRDLSAAMPAKFVEAFFSFYVDGTLDESEVPPTVAEVTGRPGPHLPRLGPDARTGLLGPQHHVTEPTPENEAMETPYRCTAAWARRRESPAARCQGSGAAGSGHGISRRFVRWPHRRAGRPDRGRVGGHRWLHR